MVSFTISMFSFQRIVDIRIQKKDEMFRHSSDFFSGANRKCWRYLVSNFICTQSCMSDNAMDSFSYQTFTVVSWTSGISICWLSSPSFDHKNIDITERENVQKKKRKQFSNNFICTWMSASWMRECCLQRCRTNTDIHTLLHKMERETPHKMKQERK